MSCSKCKSDRNSKAKLFDYIKSIFNRRAIFGVQLYCTNTDALAHTHMYVFATENERKKDRTIFHIKHKLGSLRTNRRAHTLIYAYNITTMDKALRATEKESEGAVSVRARSRTKKCVRSER